MRRRFLSLAMTLVMALTLLPATAWADDKGVPCETGLDCTEHVAAIGNKHYVTMQEAVNAVPTSGTGATTITLLNKWEISGAQVSAGKKIIFDFRDKEYTMVPPTVGSPGTETNGFQLLKGSTVTMRNGTLRAGTYLDLQVLIQNYCDLTLDYMTIDISNAPQCVYAASNNHGIVSIKDSEITAAEGQVAVDVYYWPDNGYGDGVSVTVTDSTINGDITYGSDGTAAGTEYIAEKAALNITSGTVNGLISTYKLGSDNDTGIQVSGGTFSGILPADYCADNFVQVVDAAGKSQVVNNSDTADKGYLQVAGETDIYYTDETAVAQYNEAKVASGSTTTYYATLEDAITAVTTTSPTADAPATITLLDDVTVSETVKLPDGVTLDGDGKTITADFTSAGHVIEIVNATTRVTIQNLEIDGDYNSASNPVKAGIHAFASNNIQLKKVTITNCGTVGLQINGSAVTASGLDISGSTWGSVNVDDGSSGETPSFTFNSGNLEDDVQIYTELTEPADAVITVNDPSLSRVNSGDGGQNLKGFVYYTDNPAKLGEAFNATTNTVYETLEEALEDAANNNTADTIHVIDDTTLSKDMTVKSGDTLSVSSGVELTIGANKTLTVEGTLNNSGKIDGKVVYGEDSTHTVRVIFSLSPNTATVSVAGAAPVSGSANEFLLNSNTTYSYTVSASGYYSQTGTLTVGDTPITQSVALTRIPTSTGSSSSNDYAISVDAGRHGDVTVRPSRAERGETVTITVEPDTGYELDELIVTDSSGDEISVRDRGNGRYTFTMPRSRVTIEATFVAVEDSGLPFLDVAENAWYADAVAYVYENGLMSGTASNLFSPDATTTRGMIVTMLYRLEGEPRVTTGSAFNDVDAAMYYADAIAWANANGIVTGYDEATFGPNDAITREQMAAILYRYAQYRGYRTTGSADLSGYVDADAVSTYALSALQWASAEGLVAGTSSNTLTPDGSATRAQVATIFTRFMEDVVG